MENLLVGTRISLRNILFTTDFSSPSVSALPYALSIARKYGSKLFIAHVIPPFVDPVAGLPPSPRVREAEARKEAEKVVAALPGHWRGVRHETMVRNGDIWVELSRIIAGEKIDLIVTGTRGRAGVAKLLLGSVAERIFREAPCPVLTVGPAVAGEPDSIADLHEILFATDFSVDSLTALPYAISLAQEDQARLYLLHVAPSPLDLAEEARVKMRLRNLIPLEAELSCEPKAFVEYGAPAQKILDFAEDLATDLIVLSVKRTPVFFEASTRLPLATAYKIVSQAVCPVLTVRG